MVERCLNRTDAAGCTSARTMTLITRRSQVQILPPPPMKSTSSEALPLRRQGLFAACDPVPPTTSVQRIALRAGTRRSPLCTRAVRCAFLRALPPASGPSRRDREDHARARSATLVAVEHPGRRRWRWMIGWCSTTLKPADFQLLHESEHVVCFNSSVAGVWRRSCNRIGGTTAACWSRATVCESVCR